jgi:hypothetical protein
MLQNECRTPQSSNWFWASRGSFVYGEGEHASSEEEEEGVLEGSTAGICCSGLTALRGGAASRAGRGYLDPGLRDACLKLAAVKSCG